MNVLRLAGFTAALATVAALVAAGAAASPAGASTSRPAAASPAVKSRGVLAAVSCVAPRWCMAVGSSSDKPTVTAVAWEWVHGAWHQLDDPPGGGLIGVSCSSRTFCMATGFRGVSAAVVWNGATWQAMSPAPHHVRTAPSCASSDWCALVNGVGLPGSGAIAETWNGQRWKSWADTSFCTQRPSACGVLDVSCASATTCVAVGVTPTASGDAPRAAVWNGQDWHINNPPTKNSLTIPTAVSCTGTFCMTIGNAVRAKAYVASYDATTGTWKNISRSARLPWPGTCGGGCFLPGTLSCATSTRCMTAGLGGFFAWNGRQFTPARPLSAGRGSKLIRVSCVRTFCMAVGYRTVNHLLAPLSELWNGKTWKILPT
jgi:hypothetical protein